MQEIIKVCYEHVIVDKIAVSSQWSVSESEFRVLRS